MDNNVQAVHGVPAGRPRRLGPPPSPGRHQQQDAPRRNACVAGSFLVVAPPRCLPRTSCCCHAEAFAEQPRFWRLPRVLAHAMGTDGQPRGPHLSASRPRRRNRRRRWTAGRARPAPCSSVVGSGPAKGQAAQSYRTTLGGDQGRLRLPPQAAPAEGTPRTRTGRCINRAKRTARRGRSTPPTGHDQHGCGHAGWAGTPSVAQGMP
jgi:hypothetical protein